MAAEPVRRTDRGIRRRIQRWLDQWERLRPHLHKPPIPPVLRRHGATLFTIALAFGGAWIALAVAGTPQGLVGPLVVDASVQPSLAGQ
jgi:hypothetical protein